MAHEPVLFSVEEFRDLLLPDPADRRFARVKRHGVRKNPFTALEEAKDMSEMDISIALVSYLYLACYAATFNYQNSSKLSTT